jgi:protein-S-isoprenylcysteine O-methyltransferase Ste14
MEDLFRATTAILAAASLAVRLWFPRHGSDRENAARTQETVPLALQAFSLTFGTAALALFILYPPALDIFSLPLPALIRGIGAAAGAGSVGLLAWSHAALGREFSPFLQTWKTQAMVESGPYRFVRHPMYASYFLQTCAWALISANGIIALAWTPMAAGLVMRIGIEDKMMEKRFGRLYTEYMRRTGRIFPRILRRIFPAS